MIHLAVWDPAIYKVRLKSKNGYAFLRKTHLKPGSCPLSISSSRVSVLYAGALCKREKRAFASGVI